VRGPQGKKDSGRTTKKRGKKEETRLIGKNAGEPPDIALLTERSINQEVSTERKVKTNPKYTYKGIKVERSKSESESHKIHTNLHN